MANTNFYVLCNVVRELTKSILHHEFFLHGMPSDTNFIGIKHQASFGFHLLPVIRLVVAYFLY